MHVWPQVRDGQGRKMSKSLGNVVDPVEVIGEYGTDALRFTLATGVQPQRPPSASFPCKPLPMAFRAGPVVCSALPRHSLGHCFLSLTRKT